MTRRSFVPVQGVTAFSPEDLKYLTFPDFVSILQDNKSWGHIAFSITKTSQIESFWLGLLFERKAPKGSEIHKMVQAEYLHEKEHPEGWVYHLTEYALGVFYKEYTSLQLALLRRDLLREKLGMCHMGKMTRFMREQDPTFKKFFRSLEEA